MGSVTIRNIDDEVKRGARMVAAAKGLSLEAELRDLLHRTYAMAGDEHTAYIRSMSAPDFVAHLVKVANGASFELPPRTVDEDPEIFGAD